MAQYSEECPRWGRVNEALRTAYCVLRAACCVSVPTRTGHPHPGRRAVGDPTQRAVRSTQRPLTLSLTHVSFLASLPTLPSLTLIESSLTVYLYWVAVACCVVAQVAIVRAALRTPTASVAPQMPRPQRAAEVAWVLVPAIVLALVLAFTWRAMHQAPELQAIPRGGAMVERAS